MMSSLRRWGLAVAVLGLVAGAAGPAGAGELLYSNGSGNVSGNNPFTYEFIAQDFSLAEASALQGLVFNVYTTGATVAPTTAHVKIYSDVAGAVGPELLSGDFSVSDQGVTGTSFGYTLRDYSVSLPSWSLGAGNYYLGLKIDPTQWDYHWTITDWVQNGDGSYQSSTGATGTYTGYSFEHAFQLTGERVLATPEPSTLVSIGLAGVMGLGYALRRRRAKAAA